MDFFDNHDVTTSVPTYDILDGALKRKDGQHMGDIEQKNIFMFISIKSKDSFQKLISDKVLNPDYFIDHEEIDPDELSENPDDIFKNGG